MTLTRFFTAILGVLLATTLLTSCETMETSKKDDKKGSGSQAGSRFLATDYEPLDKWFDERFEVKYANITPKTMFGQIPIDDIHYDLENLPSGPVFKFESDNISRREILKEVADFWNLKMTIKDGPDGHPSKVFVKGRG